MAKILDVSATPCSCRLDQDLVRLGLGTTMKRDAVVVRISDDEGRVGFGEAHHGQNVTAMAQIIAKGLGSLIIGHDPFDTEGIWAKLNHQQVVTHGLGAGSVIGLSGIDNALWDLKGKILGQPIYRLMGGTRKRIRAYAGGLSLGFKDPAELEEEVDGLIKQGYTAIKMRVGDNPRDDAMRVRHVRRTFGDDLDIAVDAATRYQITDIDQVIRYCQDNRVYWLEEPFTPDNIAAYAELRKRTSIPIAAGENHYTRTAFRDLFQAGAISICQADMAKTGGLTELKKIADMAAAWHIPVAPHTSHTVLSAAGNAHLLSVIPNALIYEADVARVNPFRTDLARPAYGVVDGYIEPPDGPGLGIQIDPSILEQYPAIAGPCYIPGR